MSLKNWGRIAGLFGLVAFLYAMLCWLFVTGTVQSIEVIAAILVGVGGIALWMFTNRREHPLGRGAIYGAVSAISALVLVASLSVINYIAVKKPKTWDLTKERIFTLSDQTVGVLKGLREEVTVQAFFSPADQEYGELDQRLKQYGAETDKLKVEMLDPAKHLSEVKQL